MTGRETIGSRLAQLRREKAARERRDIPQSLAAEELSVSAGAYSRWESDLRKPNEAWLERLARYFATTVPFIHYGVIASSTQGLDPRVTTGELPAVDLQRTPQVDVFESQGIEKPAPPVEKGRRRYGNGGKR